MSNVPSQPLTDILPGWALESVGELLSSPLDDAAVEAALRASLHECREYLIHKGTTPALIAAALVRARRPGS